MFNIWLRAQRKKNVVLTFWIFFDIFDFSLWGEERANFFYVFDILDFFDIFDFSLWGEEPGSGGPRNPGGRILQGTRGARRPTQLTDYFGKQLEPL